MKRIIAVISGKGGVGKSTVAVNLAIALAAGRAQRVALVDADFYGPSVPLLMGGGVVQPGKERRMTPPEKYGVKYISIGFFLRNPDDAVVWRGPMIGKAIAQLFSEVEWGEIDVCIVDMPPGTGDAPLSLVKSVKLDGAIVVTTPQEVSLADVRRAINMLRKLDIDIFGVVENMSGFVAPDGQRFDIFGSGGGERLAEDCGISFLGAIPLDTAIRQSGDNGKPIVLAEGSASGECFRRMAQLLMVQINSILP